MTEPKVYFDEPLNNPPEIPPELDRWNWGAFLLNWIWGIGNSVWITLLMFVPLVNIVMVFVLGARGSRWAWKNRAWRDVEHFRKVQRRWAIAGVVVWILSILVLAGSLAAGFWVIRNSEGYQMTLITAREDIRVTQVLGDDFEPAMLFTGSVNTTLRGGGSAAFHIPVSGSKGEGALISRLTKTDGVWKFDVLALTRDNQDPIVLIDEGEPTKSETSI